MGHYNVLNRKLVFLEEIVMTQLRPDIVLRPRVTRQFVMVELKVPWEDRTEISHYLKRQRYTELQANVWTEDERHGCYL